MSTWIKLHRSLIDWQWYEDPNALRLLIHVLVSVNYKDKKWKGILIKAGELVTSYDHLCEKLNISKQQVKTALKKLEDSGEITRHRSVHRLHISLVKWDKLQANQPDDNPTGTRQEPDRNPTITPTKEVKNNKTKINVEVKEGNIPPFSDFLKYALSRKPKINEDLLKLKYESWVENGWKDGNDKKIKNWKSKLLHTMPYIPNCDTPKEIKVVPHYNKGLKIDTGSNG